MTIAEDLETIDAAIRVAAVDGVASITAGDKTVVKRSLKELLDWRAALLSQQGTTRAGLGLRVRTITPYYP